MGTQRYLPKQLNPMIFKGLGVFSAHCEATMGKVGIDGANSVAGRKHGETETRTRKKSYGLL